MNKEVEKQKWNDILLEDCAVYDKKIAEEYTTLQERIAELEQKLEQTENDLADYQFNYPTIKELQKELDYQKQARSIAENAVVDLQQENARLKEINTHTISQLNLDNGELIIENEKLKKENAELKEELKKWKDEWQEQVQKATDEGYARTLQTIQLTKAKVIINDLVHLGEFNEHTDEEYLNYQVHEALRNAEQFISEVEK